MVMMEKASPQTSAAKIFSRRFSWAAFLIGFSMGGFFDGILLHQILQWHHLLSLVESPLVQDIRIQILADGLFHALMYLLATMGLYLLWRTREQFALAGAGQWQMAGVLLGFGIWNIVDAGLFHWILQIHRIRIDSASPLLWDLLWFTIFGLAFTLAGWKLRQRIPAGGRGNDKPGNHTSTVMGISIAVITAGLVAAAPPEDKNSSMIFFKPGTTPSQVFSALDTVDGRILWADRSGTLWAVHLADNNKAAMLYRHGALFVGRSWLAIGCLSWLQA